MGGGNGAKAATARARKAEKDAKPKGALQSALSRGDRIGLHSCVPKSCAATDGNVVPVLLLAGSQVKANQAALTQKCHVCLTQFVCTVSRCKCLHAAVLLCSVAGLCVDNVCCCVQSKEQQLKDHQENKHPKSTFEVRQPALPQAVSLA